MFNSVSLPWPEAFKYLNQQISGNMMWLTHTQTDTSFYSLGCCCYWGSDVGNLLCAVTCEGECPKTDTDGSKPPTEEIFPVDQTVSDCDDNCGNEKNGLELKLETRLYCGLDQDGQVHDSLMVPDLVHPLSSVQTYSCPPLLVCPL